jgi:hypothetical protein
LALKRGEFFCEQKGKNFGNNRTVLFLCLTKKQAHGKKSVKMLLTFFVSLAAGVSAAYAGTINIQTIHQ